jgi:hypothetical protein
MTFDIGSLGSLRLRNQFAVVLVTIVIALSVTGASAKRTIPAHHPSSQLVKVGAYPTQVVATVRSVTMQKIYLGPEFSDDHADATLCIIKLRVHTTKALTEQGTTINDNESVEVISREPIKEALVGKTVKALIEMRGDSTRERWLLTEVLSRP